MKKLISVEHLIKMKYGMSTLEGMNCLKNKCIRTIANLLIHPCPSLARLQVVAASPHKSWPQ